MNLNANKIANDLGYTRAHIGRIKKGERTPQTALIKHFCLKYNISESWLMSGIGAMKDNSQNGDKMSQIERAAAIYKEKLLTKDEFKKLKATIIND
ncbi:transcriptional regulator [Candidatus Magnetomorum sp. HK-1]|nr:transcriptional regulator [Candidatus Magnetomorum sp. HK-1]